MTRPKIRVRPQVGWLTSQQQTSVSQGRICTDNFMYCHTKIEVADPTLHLTRSWYTDTGPTSPSADPITPGAWQGSHWSANFCVAGMTRLRKIPAQAGFEPGIFRSRGGRLTTRPRRRSPTVKAGFDPWSAALKMDALPLGHRDSSIAGMQVCVMATAALR